MTAPITSNRPTTTRLHHYAGRHSHGSGIPVETFFAPAWGASTPVEIFFAHAHPKWLIFDHFHLAGAIFLSQRHPKLPPGATQGRSFFHTAPRDDTESPPVWRVPEYPEGLAAVPVGGGGAWPRCPWVAAGPGRASRSTTPSAARVWRSRGRADAHRHIQRAGLARWALRHAQRAASTGLEGAGGAGGLGRASRRGAERSEDAKSRGRPGPPAPGKPVEPSATRDIMLARRPRAHRAA